MSVMVTASLHSTHRCYRYNGYGVPASTLWKLRHQEFGNLPKGSRSEEDRTDYRLNQLFREQSLFFGILRMDTCKKSLLNCAEDTWRNPLPPALSSLGVRVQREVCKWGSLWANSGCSSCFMGTALWETLSKRPAPSPGIHHQCGDDIDQWLSFCGWCNVWSKFPCKEIIWNWWDSISVPQYWYMSISISQYINLCI